MTEAQATTTRFCARVAGPFLLLIALMVLTRYDTLEMLLPSLQQNAALVMVAGVWTALLGFILFTAHHHFNSPAAATISVLALLLVLRGALLLLQPEALIAVAGGFVDAPPVMYAFTALTLLLGAWLSFVGWVAKKV